MKEHTNEAFLVIHEDRVEYTIYWVDTYEILTGSDPYCYGEEPATQEEVVGRLILRLHRDLGILRFGIRKENK